MEHLDELKEEFVDANYLPNTEILTLSKLATQLNKPILVEGPPGTGKTSLAKAIAKINNTELYRIQCYEGITSEQIIGEFNYQKQLLAIEQAKQDPQHQADVFDTDYFIARPLLKAMRADSQVVLLIDEIDRADEEFEAFLLEALGEGQITVPELGTIEQNQPPIVILTSNGTRELSGALRRRSLFLALDYPSPQREREILKLHVPELDDKLYEDIVSLLRKIRRNDHIIQPPSISEGIELAQALTVLGQEYIKLPKLREIMGLLVKSSADTTHLQSQLEELEELQVVSTAEDADEHP